MRQRTIFVDYGMDTDFPFSVIHKYIYIYRYYKYHTGQCSSMRMHRTGMRARELCVTCGSYLVPGVFFMCGLAFVRSNSCVVGQNRLPASWNNSRKSIP